MKQYKKVILGFDQSYQNTGVCVIADGEKRIIRTIPLLKYEHNIQRRKVLRSSISKLLQQIVPKAEEIICIIERIRLFSKGFVNIDYIKAIGALNSTIVDVCSEFGVEVYSVDTRCWKAQVIGTSKRGQNRKGVPEEKWNTVKWCLDNGWSDDILHTVEGRRTKDTFTIKDVRYYYDTDSADAAGIAHFGIVGDYAKLQREY